MRKVPGTEFYGDSRIGGKASGLVSMIESLLDRGSNASFPMHVSVPEFSVITTEFFLDFVQRNDLVSYAEGNDSDDRIAMAFIRGEMSPRLTGELWKFVGKTREPVAVRSSSLLEDDLKSPLAGIYQTKMIPNNQPSDEIRFRKLIEAVKLVWASTYFSDSREFHRGIGGSASEETMAVILQKVVGRRYGNRFYPLISGVARSFNYYAFGKANPSDGVVSLALGLGKSIVDGGLCWSYSPANPKAPPPFGSAGDILKGTQSTFWAVNMEKITVYDPVAETEYMISSPLADADYDDTLKLVASTYLPESDRFVHGTGREGPKVVNFAPVLDDRVIPLNDAVRAVLELCSEEADGPVEIEFAVTGPGRSEDASLGLLQVRPIASFREEVDIPEAEIRGARTVAFSRRALGNGIKEIKYVVYVKPESFSTSKTRQIATEIAGINRKLSKENQGYLLIGYGRWGSSDPWLGIPVTWGHISGAEAMIEISGPRMRVELSQGSHFFHNLSSFGVGYLSVNEPLDGPVNLDIISDGSEIVHETEHIRCLKIEEGVTVKIDGRKGLGVVLK
ncbi:hypothetical protein DRQ25_01770 [Candidatus Fermentibacteria bacterium]|nr:MAG: hypothetical protein DRQ25_01770 [Candidatus Fermentibacteria bacterium]